MKFKIYILILGLALSAGTVYAQAQKEYILLGEITADSLRNDTACKWFGNPPPYTPCEAFTGKLTAAADKLFVKIYCGNWCEDTQRELPRFIKVADATGLKYSLYFLDRNKQSPGGAEKKDTILFIPTFILLKEGIEVGRVVESAPYGIEKHLADLLKK
ncbi:MAG: thioredoxin family protein [Bacteroidia bacterium]|nr:thioredoxin family protein [Bacteroidia bacterium]